MKKNIYVVFISSLISLLSFADTEKVGNYTWTYYVNGNGVEIYRGGATAISPKPTGAVTIPSTLGGKSVTGIGTGAFYGCSDLTSLTIPSSITNVGINAFSNCSSLEEFIVRLGNTMFKGDGEWLLSKDGRTIVAAPCGGRNSSIPNGVTRIGSYAFCYNKISSIRIPSTVTTIDDHAFNECTNLKSATIPNSVTSIGAYAFQWCALTDIVIPGSVLSIGYGAFAACDLKSVTINEGVANISDYAFFANRQLISVTIPNSVRSIGEQAFARCSSLTSITIPDSVTNIGEDCFDECASVNSVRIPFVPDGCTSNGTDYVSGLSYFFGRSYHKEQLTDRVPKLHGTVPGTLRKVIVGSTNYIGDYAFYNCSNLTSVTISSGVKNIGNSAFYGCEKLTGMTIPNSVTNIGTRAFYGCENMTRITIPDSVTSVGADAFSRCYGMTGVTIGSGVRSLGSSAFYSCNNLTTVNISDIASWCDVKFASWNSNPLYYAKNLYLNGSLVRDLTVPVSVINICNYAFYGFDGLTSVTIPEGVTSIGHDAFYGCSGLTNVVFGGNAPSVGDSAFRYVNSSCVVYVPHSSTGWGVEIPGIWNGIAIQYYPWVKMRFNLGGHAVRTGGGALEQEVLYQSATVAPEFKADYGWLFRGWDADLSCMQSNMTINALWSTTFESGESAQWTWQTGTTWKSGSIGNDASSWLGLTVDGAGRLSFKWKTSSEEYNGDVFDYVYLSVDGEAKGGLNDYKTQGVALGGKTGWQNVVVDIIGDGSHDIKWIFIKDDVDESDCGEDCAWVSNVSFSPLVSVTFGLNGGEGIVPDPITALANTQTNLSMATMFHREDYVFAGWSDGARMYQAGAAYKLPAENVVMTAQWLPKTFVSFSLNEGVGNVPATIKQLPETIVTLPSSDGFNREGFAFAGWSDGAVSYAGGAQYVVPSNNVTLCAQWIEKKTVSYSIGEATGVAPTPQTDVPGVKVAIPSNEGFNRARYSFVGWNDGVETLAPGDEYVIPDGNVEMTAVWLANELATPVIASTDVANGGTTESAYVDVAISAESGTLIYYTTDGTVPTAGSIRYDGTFRVVTQQATIKAIAVRDNFFDSGIATFTFTRKPFSVEECIDVGDDVVVESGGDAAWVRDLTVTHDGKASIRSGSISDGESSWVEMRVSGVGQIDFWWKVSSEISRNRKMDYVSFEIDGTEMSWLGGDKDWTNEVYSIVNGGEHVLKWIYRKNDNGATQGMDCAWLDGVTWMSVDPLPEVASDSDVTNALAGAVDETRLRAHLSDKAMYDQFRAWVNAKGLDHEAVKNSARAWFSYAIGASGLVEKAFLNDDVTIDSPTPTSDGGLSFEVNVKDALIGEGATPANLESVFRVQGAYSLRENAFSSKNVVSEISASANGSMAVTVRPKHATDAFFARMCMYADGEPGPEPDEELLPTCTVTFDANGGVGGTTVSVFQRSALETLPTPTCEGYEFKGWFTAVNGGTQVTASTIVMADVTYYAHWTRGKVQLWSGGPYWATMNIGAEKPEDYGLHFWWGDTIGYRRENNAWVASDGSSSNFSFSLDNVPNYGKNKATLQSEGWITADGVLAPEHDTAHVQWGGDWRMPTEQELFDLNSNCDWTWTTKKGVSGYIVRGRGDYAASNIFLPAAGYGLGTSLECVAAGGYYWFSDPKCELYFNCVEHRKNVIDSNFGFTVRPVQGSAE